LPYAKVYILLQYNTSKETNWKNCHQINSNKVNSETQTETVDSGLHQDMLNGNMSDSAHSQVKTYNILYKILLTILYIL